MADNAPTTATDTGSSREPVATDYIGGAHYQRVKLTQGGDGTATAVSATDPLLVAGTAVVSSVGGTVTIAPVAGTVTVANPTADPETGLATQATLSSLDGKLPDESGTWDYDAGAAGTVTIAAGQRVLGIAAHATTAGSAQINGGDWVPVPANASIEIVPRANLTGAGTVVFAGTDSYFLETIG